MAQPFDGEAASRRRRWLAGALLLLATLVPLVDAWSGGALVDSPLSTAAVVLAGFVVGAWWRPVPAGVAVGAGSAFLAAANQLAEPAAYSVPNDLVFFVVLLGGSTLAGALVGARRRQVRELRRLSAALALQQADEASAAAADERRRLLVELAASLLEPVDGLEGLALHAAAGSDADVCSRIEQTARTTLVELRTVLGSLDPVRAESPVTAARAPAARPEPPLGWTDVLVAAAGVPVAVETVAGAAAHGRPTAVLLGIALVGALLGVPLLVRRRHPLVAVAGVALIALLLTTTLTPLSRSVSVLLPLSLAGYAIGAHARGLRRWLAAVVALGGVAASAVVRRPVADPDDGLAPTLVWVLVALVFGALAAQESDRAGRLVEVVEELEAGQDHAVRLARAEGREALARDLHDSLAHAMTIVCLHAEAAQLPGNDPVRVLTSMAAVAAAAREASAQLRSGLTVFEVAGDLRGDLAAIVAGLGLTASVVVSGPVAPAQAVLVRRIVREALVNVARHAPGAEVTVAVAASAAQVVVEVGNTSPVPGSPAPRVSGAGRGLAGLVQLADRAGGRLEHGPGGAGGFRVVAHLPARVVAPPRVPA